MRANNGSTLIGTAPRRNKRPITIAKVTDVVIRETHTGLLIKFRKKNARSYRDGPSMPDGPGMVVVLAICSSFWGAINIRGIYRVGSTAERKRESYVNYRCEGFTILPFNSREEAGRLSRYAKIIFTTVGSNGKKINTKKMR